LRRSEHDTVIRTMTSTVHSMRRMMNVSTAPPSPPSAAWTGVEGIPYPVPNTFSESTVSRIMIRGQRDPRPVYSRSVAVLDDRSPADIRRLDTDPEEGSADSVKMVVAIISGSSTITVDTSWARSPEDQPQVARALGDRGRHELLVDHREHLAADRAVDIRHEDERDDDRGQPQAGRA